MKTHAMLLKAAVLAVLIVPECLGSSREIGSPRALSQKVVTVPGTTPDYIDRGPTRMSPKLMQQQGVRMSGTTPDRIDRGPMKESPKLRSLSGSDRKSPPQVSKESPKESNAPARSGS